MNNSLQTNVFVRFTPETIACACIFLAARELKVGTGRVTLPWTERCGDDGSLSPLQIPLPQRPPWWLVFDAKYEDIEV